MKKFVKKAYENKVKIIPLMQSMGHLEMVLEKRKYKKLREVPERIDCINPLAEGAKEIITAMLEEMLEFFHEVDYFHLGGDEVWCLGKNPQTADYIEANSKAKLYRKFMEPLLDKIINKGIRPIIWHDMLSSWEIEDIKCFTQKTDLMVWGYSGTPDTSTYHYRREVIDKFAAANAPMWAAGQLKGRFEPPHLVLKQTCLEDRIMNTSAWINAYKQYSMKGICLTAWARNSSATHQNVPLEANLDYLIYLGKMLCDGQVPQMKLGDAISLLDVSNQKKFKRILDRYDTYRDNIELYWLKSRYLRYILAGTGWKS